MPLFSWIEDMKVKNHASKISNFLEGWKMLISLLSRREHIGLFALCLLFQSTTPDLLCASRLPQMLHPSKTSSLGNGAAVNWASCTCMYSKLTCYWGVALLVIQLINLKRKPECFPNIGFSPNHFCTWWGYDFYSAPCLHFTAKPRIFFLHLAAVCMESTAGPWVLHLASSLKPGVQVPSVCGIVGQEWRLFAFWCCFLELDSFVMFNQLLKKWGQGWIIFTLLTGCLAAKLVTVSLCSLVTSLIWQKNQC